MPHTRDPANTPDCGAPDDLATPTRPKRSVLLHARGGDRYRPRRPWPLSAHYPSRPAPAGSATSNTVADRFLKLPNAYWTDGWCDKLGLPALAMLLVALAEKHGFELPTEKVPKR